MTSDIDVKQASEMTSLAANMAVDQGKKFLESEHLLVMKTWSGDGPMTFRVLALVGGGIMLVLGFLGALSSLLNPLNCIFSLYFMIFGTVTIMLEAKDMKQLDKFRALVFKEAKFLTFLNGRGGYYVFVGTMLMAQSNFLETVLGLYMVICGGIMIGIGSHANKKLEAMKAHITDEAAVAKAFNEADKDGSKTLTALELAQLCKDLGSELNQNELEAAMLCLDKDGSNAISLDEFQAWWRHTTPPVDV